jgi:hypothetical protein
VTCRPHKVELPLSSLPSRKRVPLERGPDPRLFFHPNLTPIFFQLLLSGLTVCGLVPEGTFAKPVSEVGGVFGGVMGSKVEAEGEVESVLSSVRLSGPSAGDAAGEPERYADRRAELRPKAAVK